MVELNAQTLLYPIFGGAILSLAIILNLWMKGRPIGFSSILTGVFVKDITTIRWKSSFLAGFLFLPALLYDIYNNGSSELITFYSASAYVADLSLSGLLVSGFAVGFGTRLAGGDTSGHGLSGIPSLSKSSLISMIVFFIAAFVTANLRSYYGFFMSSFWPDAASDMPTFIIVNSVLVVSLIGVGVNFKLNKDGMGGVTDILISFMTGGIFAAGLLISGVYNRVFIVGFLTFNSNWNPNPLFAYGTAILLNLIAFRFLYKLKKPCFANDFIVTKNSPIEIRMVVGSAIFGYGYGISGLCPGPAILGLLFYVPQTLIYCFCIAIGVITATFVLGNRTKDKTGFLADY